MTWLRTAARGAPFAFCAGVFLLVWYPFGTFLSSPLAAVWSRVHDAVVVILLMAALPVLVRILRTRGTWFRDLPPLYLALCMISVIPLTGVPTLGLAYARMQWVTLATFAAVYLCAYAVSLRRTSVIVSLLIIWLSWTMTSAIRAVAAAVAGGSFAHDVLDPMGHTNSRAGFELGMMLVGVGIVWKGTKGIRRVGVPLLLVFLLSLSLSLSRGAWLGMAAAIAVGVGRQWGVKRAALTVVAFVLLIAVVPGTLGERARTVTDAGFATNLFRLKMWGAAIQLIGENPWGGAGYDTLWFAMLSHLGTDMSTLAGKHVHNLLLQTWGEVGVLGTAALIGVFVAALRHGWALNSHSSWWIRGIAWGLVLAWVGTIAHGFVDCTWRDYGHQVMFWSVVGWVFAMAEQDRIAP